MEAALLEGIVRIEVGGSRGTGFVVRVDALPSGPDGCRGRVAVDILTALHVVADLKTSRLDDAASWRGAGACVRFRGVHEVEVPLDGTTRHSIADDWAVLRYEGPLPCDVVALRLARVETDLSPRDWETFGYGDAESTRGEAHSGLIELAESNSLQLFDRQLSAGTGGFPSGFSGAPCIQEGHVVGVVIAALQKTTGESVHATVYALPIERMADTCGLPLAPAGLPFEAEVQAALRDVDVALLEREMSGLGLPPMTSPAARVRWMARALLGTDQKKLRKVLCGCADFVDAKKRLGVAEMALAQAVREETVAVVRRCLESGTPKGVVTVASEELTARLLVARALQRWALVKRHFKYVDTRDPSRAAWARRIRDALMGLLGITANDCDDDAALDAHIAEELADREGAILAFQYDERLGALDEIERWAGARALALVSTEAGATFSRDGYEVTRPYADHASENEVKKAHSCATREFAGSPRPE